MDTFLWYSLLSSDRNSLKFRICYGLWEVISPSSGGVRRCRYVRCDPLIEYFQKNKKCLENIFSGKKYEHFPEGEFRKSRFWDSGHPTHLFWSHLEKWRKVFLYYPISNKGEGKMEWGTGFWWGWRLKGMLTNISSGILPVDPIFLLHTCYLD